MGIDKAIVLKKRIIKFSKKNVRILNVKRGKSNSCDKRNFDAIVKNRDLRQKFRQLCSGVYFYEDFLSPRECDLVIAVSQDKVARSAVAGENQIKISKHRTSQGYVLDDDAVKSISVKIRNVLENITQLPMINQEELKVVKYSAGQEYKIHHDCHLTLADGTENLFLLQGGQRVFSCLIYLNDGFEGGGTNFPKLNLLCTPKAGSLIIWNNLDGHDIKSEMVHCAEPVIAGEKWAITTWVRQFEYQPGNQAET